MQQWWIHPQDHTFLPKRVILSKFVSLNTVSKIIYEDFVFRSEEISAEDTTSSPLPPESQRTYLVFERSLLLLFTMCLYCGNAVTKIKKKVNGSFLHITQWCEKCRRKRMWRSQPYIGNIPAGNILTSAAILYSGSLPSKVLHVFKILKCFMITSRSFFHQQSKYVQPSVHSVWVQHKKDC